MPNKKLPISATPKPSEEKKKSFLSINIEAIKETFLNFVIPLVSFVASVILIILVVYPIIRSYPEVKAELKQKTTLKKTLEDKVADLRKLVDFKDFVEEDSDLINRVLVSEAEVPKLLDQVHQIATNSGMVVDRLSYSYGGGEAVASSVVNISLGADTNYDQIVLFMESVENAARFVKVPSFRYSSGVNKQGESKLSANFSFESPYLFVQSNAVTDEPIKLDISAQEFVDFINMIKGLRYYEFLNIEVEAVEETEETEEIGEEVPAEGEAEETAEEDTAAETETPSE